MRNRGSAIIIKNHKVVLIKRVKDQQTYYVFPGGGVEKNETPEMTTKREAYEELGVVIQVGKCLAKTTFNGKQYFFLSTIEEGTIGKGKGEEYTNVTRNRGTYEPLWMAIEQLPTLDLKPREVAEIVYSYYNK